MSVSDSYGTSTVKGYICSRQQSTPFRYHSTMDQDDWSLKSTSPYKTFNYNYEEERLRTFDGWTYKVPPSELARNGFYWLHMDDKCACFACNIIIGKWMDDDTVHEEHVKHSPECNFLQGISTNISLKHCQLLKRLRKPPKRLDELLLPHNSPSFSRYADESVRRQSFFERKGLAVQLRPRVMIEELVEAGFFSGLDNLTT